MLVYIAIACIGANDIMIVDDDEYYELNLIQFENKEKRAKYTLFAIGGFYSLFVCFRLENCRSPPLFNLILKKQIEWRKERWQIAQKEENIGIILIF